MTILQRFGYYLGGFSLGLVILAFFLNGKKASCSYGPDSRVLKNINSKKIIFSPHVKSLISDKKIDSNTIRWILKKGDLNFSEGNPRKKPCGIYVIEGEYKENPVFLTVENCDSIATILKARLNSKTD